jgi:hypothetical protein
MGPRTRACPEPAHQPLAREIYDRQFAADQGFALGVTIPLAGWAQGRFGGRRVWMSALVICGEGGNARRGDYHGMVWFL